MNFADAVRDLSRLGWRCTDETLLSPSGGFGFTREQLESDALSIYGPAARRAYNIESLSPEYRRELVDLLRVLASDPRIAALVAHLSAIEVAMAGLVTRHRMKLSSWDFSYPNVRATALHPVAGMVAIECGTGGPPDCELRAFHWVDDPGPVRRTRDDRFVRGPIDVARLSEEAEAAARFLLAPTGPGDFTSHPGLGGGGRDAYRARFDVLR